MEEELKFSHEIEVALSLQADVDQDCVRKVLHEKRKKGHKIDKQAIAIAINECKSKMSKNSLIGIPMIIAGNYRPTPQQRLFDQQYCSYTSISPFERNCGNCMHYIQGDNFSDNTCQIVEANPQRILPEGHCRFWRSSYELSGFITSPIEMDDSLPEDIKMSLNGKDVEDEEETNDN